MADRQLPDMPKNTVRINKSKLARNPVFWLLAIFFFLLFGYSVLLFGYYRDLYPPLIDTAVQASRLAFFKEKIYAPGSVGNWDGVLDPGLTRVVENTEMSVTYSGYIEEVQIVDGYITRIVLSRADQSSLPLDGHWEVSQVLVETCMGGDECEAHVYVPGVLEDVVPGSLAEVAFEENLAEGTWSIHKIRIRSI